jgi:hypothetical protein
MPAPDPSTAFCLDRIGKTEAIAGLPVAMLRPLVARRWNRAFQDAVDGLIRRAADVEEAGTARPARSRATSSGPENRYPAQRSMGSAT